jgi:hypothetical protein
MYIQYEQNDLVGAWLHTEEGRYVEKHVMEFVERGGSESGHSESDQWMATKWAKTLKTNQKNEKKNEKKKQKLDNTQEGTAILHDLWCKHFSYQASLSIYLYLTN